MTAIAEGFVFRVTAATEVNWRKLTVREFFSRVIQNLCATGDFVRTVLQSFNRYVGHDSSSVKSG